MSSTQSTSFSRSSAMNSSMDWFEWPMVQTVCVLTGGLRDNGTLHCRAGSRNAAQPNVGALNNKQA